jgi:proteasome accessory factor A
MDKRIYGLENEYGLIYQPKGRRVLLVEKVIWYLFNALNPVACSSNLFLDNGARVYQESGSHPEYSTPECDNLLDLVAYDKAGERILENALCSAEQELRKDGFPGEIFIFKNNTDSKGSSYGCHENYLVSRKVQLWVFLEALYPFLVTRQIFAGSGKVYRGPDGARFHLSQRAQHIYQKISDSTTNSRPMISTRDEPHADPEKFRRLHIIVGDSNMSEFTNYLKVGTTALVIRMIEDGFLGRELELEDSIRALREISMDLTLRRKVRLRNGREWTALDIQREYLNAAESYFSSRTPDLATKDVLAKWALALDRLEEEPCQLRREIDWVAKWSLITDYMSERGCTLDDPRIWMIDLQYHDIKRNRGLYYLLERRDRMERMLLEETVLQSMKVPPQNTRAKIRGDFIKFAREHNKTYSVDWCSIKLGGFEDRIIYCLDPFKASDKRVERLMASSSAVSPPTAVGVCSV